MDRYQLTSMILFGSVARNEAGPDSDVDVMVHMPPDIYAQSALAEELERALGVRVGLIRAHDGLRPFFLKRVERDGVHV